MKRRSPKRREEGKRITVRLPNPTAAKLDRIAQRITPKGSEPSAAAAVRNLIEKEAL